MRYLYSYNLVICLNNDVLLLILLHLFYVLFQHNDELPQLYLANNCSKDPEASTDGLNPLTISHTSDPKTTLVMPAAVPAMYNTPTIIAVFLLEFIFIF